MSAIDALAALEGLRLLARALDVAKADRFARPRAITLWLAQVGFCGLALAAIWARDPR